MVRLALSLALAALALASAAPRAVAAEPPYEINALLSLTGQNAFLGNEELQVLQTVEDLVNKGGGIRGRAIKFVVADDQTNPQVAVQLAGAIIAKKVPVLLGPGISSTCKAVLPLVVNGGPVTMCYTPAFNPEPGKYVFSSTVSTFDTTAVGIRYAREKGWTRLALLTTSDATGQDVEGHMRESLALPENKGVTLVASEHFNAGDVSVAAQVAKIKAAGPQAIFISATGTPFGTALHGLHDAGLDLPVWTGVGNMTYDQMTQYGAFLPKVLIFSGMIGMRPDIVRNGPIRNAQRVYFDAFEDRKLKTTTGSNLSWDGTMLVIDALRHVGFGASAQQVHDYIEHLTSWPGINGYYNFTSGSQRGVGQNSMVVLQWDPQKRDFVAVSKLGG